jgi:hypothetical protein
LGDGVPKLALGGPPGGVPGADPSSGPYMWKTQQHRKQERHGAIDRKRAVKTPTKA